MYAEVASIIQESGKHSIALDSSERNINPLSTVSNLLSPVCMRMKGHDSKRYQQ